MKKPKKTEAEFFAEMDAKMRDLLYGEGGPLDCSPPVLPMLKKWTGLPRFHLDTAPAALTSIVQGEGE